MHQAPWGTEHENPLEFIVCSKTYVGFDVGYVTALHCYLISVIIYSLFYIDASFLQFAILISYLS